MVRAQITLADARVKGSGLTAVILHRGLHCD